MHLRQENVITPNDMVNESSFGGFSDANELRRFFLSTSQ